jgi:hypothetical protein
MQQFYQGMSQAWGALMDGWREFYHRAANHKQDCHQRRIVF